MEGKWSKCAASCSGFDMNPLPYGLLTFIHSLCSNQVIVGRKPPIMAAKGAVTCKEVIRLRGYPRMRAPSAPVSCHCLRHCLCSPHYNGTTIRAVSHRPLCNNKTLIRLITTVPQSGPCDTANYATTRHSPTLLSKWLFGYNNGCHASIIS